MSHAKRLIGQTESCLYHLISRARGGNLLFNETAKKIMQKQLHQVADFCGVQVLTYALMGNHFHVLARITKQTGVSDSELLRRFKVLHPNPTKYVTLRTESIEAAFKAGAEAREHVRNQLLRRMGDVSRFMELFKQRFSIWYNKNHECFGTLWADRFTSVIVQGDRHFAMQAMAAYIDLNPVRAGLVEDPKDYRYCGYGEAVAVGGEILKGLRHALGVGATNRTDAGMLEYYRLKLFGKGSLAKRGDGKAARISEAALRRVESSEGKLPLCERFLTRVLWFTKGGVIGSKSFVEDTLRHYSAVTGKRRHCEIHSFSDDTSAQWESLYSLRGGATV
jgi:REP element-mobilizing transposase RayT